MRNTEFNYETIGAFKGKVADGFRSTDLVEWLERVSALIYSEDAEVLTDGRNRNVRLNADCKGDSLSVVVKAFGKPSLLKNAIDRCGRGSKALRTWLAAVHLDESGVGTPAPVAFMERWVENRLVESYVVTVYEAGISDFKTELNRLFRLEPECAKIMTLIQVVADGIRRMHEAGFMHNDLGNQNVMLRRCSGDEEWGDFQVIDLNRGYLRDNLTNRERARDISRIYLPSDFLRVFIEMYFDDLPPEEFILWERRYRRRYAFHAKSRSWRHPIREWKIRKAHKVINGDNSIPDEYPSERDLWVWDERSGQAQTTLLSRDKSKYYPKLRIWRVVGSLLKALIPVWVEYRKLLKNAYREPVKMNDRVSVAIEVYDDRLEQQCKLLDDLGEIPVFIRFYHHRSEEDRAKAVAAVKRLDASGHQVGIALVQDRMAVRNPGAWHVFAEDVMREVGNLVSMVEIGHAINRVKWGLWGFNEYTKLINAVVSLKSKYPKVTFSGPAVIDFDYPYTLAALARLPDEFRFGALSSHLYVDRRGAPENRQGQFSSLEKFALGRAIANWSGNCDNRFIVSEVNWPIKNTGVYSPVGSPYVSRGERLHDPSVSEDDYADYMLRYLLIAICSGFVEQVYWWRLAAFGYGLVDDFDNELWRERAAYKTLKTFLKWVINSTFVKRIELNDCGAVAFEFTNANNEDAGVEENVDKFWLVYTSGDEGVVEMPFEVLSAEDALGNSIDVGEGGTVKLTGRVVCLR